jgi:hypothetical protein
MFRYFGRCGGFNMSGENYDVFVSCSRGDARDAAEKRWQERKRVLKTSAAAERDDSQQALGRTLVLWAPKLAHARFKTKRASAKQAIKQTD